jgi:hypothetical protein
MKHIFEMFLRQFEKIVKANESKISLQNTHHEEQPATSTMAELKSRMIEESRALSQLLKM